MENYFETQAHDIVEEVLLLVTNHKANPSDVKAGLSDKLRGIAAAAVMDTSIQAQIAQMEIK